MATIRTLEQWQVIIEAQKTSGLKVADYCKQHDINPTTFYNRRAKLGLNAHLTKPDFIKVEPVRLEPTPTLVLTFGEAKLDIPTGASPQWIASLLKAIDS
jgi:hypothetical protein